MLKIINKMLLYAQFWSNKPYLIAKLTKRINTEGETSFVGLSLERYNKG